MIGRTITHYRVLETVGSGGMGVVYKAEDTRLGRMVAIKMLPEDLPRDRVALERFQREARAASALNHPNICTIYEIDEFEGKPFLVMELLEGRSLADRGPLEPAAIVDLAIEFADALAAAHDAGIIHRDLKPANLFLTRRGQLKILDFGLAKQVGEQEPVSGAATAMRDLTGGGTTVGTVAYMSPEQARGEPLDRRTDLFSFGAVLYELVSGHRAFGGSTTALVFDAILHRDPAPVAGELGPIIQKALQKDRELRYQSAADIRADLKRLKHESGTAAVPKAAGKAPWMMFAAAAIAVIAAALGLWHFRAPRPQWQSKQVTVAVLPFSNLGGNRDRDYLRLALPDELVTVLSHSRSLAVRPFAMTKKFGGDSDPQQVGKSVQVASVITGNFRDAGQRLGITVEAIDVEKNDIVWRDSFEVGSEDLIALRNNLSNHVRAGLLPSLHVSSQSEPNRPRNDEAYALFMRAAAMSNDPAPNKEALTMLRRAVELDPSYAPAWSDLADREYYDNEYGGGGEPARVRALEDSRRALSLDPDLTDSATRLIGLDVEGGQTEDAYRQARDLLRRRAENADAHFTVAYVLRYAGLLDESVKECETARSIDPNNPRWRSCGLALIQLGDLARARQYLDLDSRSVWTRNVEVGMLVRQGRNVEALKSSVELGASGATATARRYLEAILTNRSHTETEAMAREARLTILRIGDAEPAYFSAAMLARLGERTESLALLRSLAPRNYCAYPALDRDPAFVLIRNATEFQQIRSDAIQCQQRFLQWRAENAP